MTESRTVYVRVKPTEEFAEDFVKIGEDGQSVTIKSLTKPKRSFLKHQISSYSFQFASILQNADQQCLISLLNLQLTMQLMAFHRAYCVMVAQEVVKHIR